MNPDPDPQPTVRSTKTVLKKSAASTKKGKKLTLTATITGLGTGTGSPTGTVKFFAGTKLLGTGVVKVVGGVKKAVFATTKLAVGTHSLKAVYGGDTLFSKSTSAVVAHVVKRA